MNTAQQNALGEALENAWSAAAAAVRVYDLTAQRRMAIEETSELCVAMCHEDRGRVGKQQVRTEIADVIIVMLQLVAMYGIDECVDELKAKTERLWARVRAKEGA